MGSFLLDDNLPKVARFSTIGFAELRSQIDEFQSYLVGHGIGHPASSLANLLTLARETVVAAENNAVPDEFDAHSGTDALGNVGYLARCVLRVRGTEFEEQLIPKLRHLGSGVPSPLSPGPRSEDRDKVFEAICGCVCARFAEDVRFTEPDIACKFDGESWGIACKVAYGKPSTIVQNIRKGCHQVAQADVSKGLIVVQATNLFPHGAMYAHAPDGDILSLQEVEAQQSLFVQNLRTATQPVEMALAEEFNTRGLPSSPTVGVAFVVQTLAYFRARRSMMAGLLYCPLDGQTRLSPGSFLGRFNQEWQRI